MVTLLLKKSYLHKDLKEIKFNDLWNGYGIFTTMRVIGRSAKILFYKAHIDNLIKSLNKYNIRKNKAQELLNAGLDLIGKDKPNSWLRGMYFTNNPKRKPYTPLHEIYGKFDCPIVDSYSNKIDWISIFE